MRRRNQRGLAIVTFSMIAAVMVPFLGLTMDAAMLCVVKERLTTAVSCAASAAARYPEQGTKMESAVHRFLDANFPEGHMGTGARTVAIKGGQLEVRVDAPTYFMKLIHVRSVEVVASHSLR